MKGNLRGRNKLLILWYMQEGLCPNCNEKITKETGWNIHQIQRKTGSGKGNVVNLMLLHPKCHRHMHSREKKVTTASGQTGVLKLEPCAAKVACTVLRGAWCSNALCLPD